MLQSNNNRVTMFVLHVSSTEKILFQEAKDHSEKHFLFPFFVFFAVWMDPYVEPNFPYQLLQQLWPIHTEWKMFAVDSLIFLPWIKLPNLTEFFFLLVFASHRSFLRKTKDSNWKRLVKTFPREVKAPHAEQIKHRNRGTFAPSPEFVLFRL